MNIFARARTKHLEIGRRGENFAVKLYCKRNASILGRNWRNSSAHDGSGELDIVLLDGETLVFVEVKTRRKLDNYLPGANLSDKQKKLIRQGAKTFCRMNHISSDVNKRFDLVEVIYDGKRLHDIALHENYMAFSDPEFLTRN